MQDSFHIISEIESLKTNISARNVKAGCYSQGVSNKTFFSNFFLIAIRDKGIDLKQLKSLMSYQYFRMESSHLLEGVLLKGE